MPMLNITNDLRALDYVVSLPTAGHSGQMEYSDAACDALTMTEDGPVPMKNMKPVLKNPTGAEQFWLEHQAEYDAYGKPADKYRNVDSHNKAYPKLIDELQKKRSTAMPMAIATGCNYATKTAATYDPKCKICVKLRKEQMKREKKRKRNTEKRRNRGRARVPPYRKRQRRAKPLTLRKLTQHAAASASEQSHLSLNHSVNSCASKAPSKRPNSGASSVESYYTYYSADHEPMLE